MGRSLTFGDPTRGKSPTGFSGWQGRSWAVHPPGIWAQWRGHETGRQTLWLPP